MSEETQKDSLFVQIANEAIKRLQTKIDAVNKIVNDNPIMDMIEIDKKAQDLVDNYGKCNSLKEINNIANELEDLKKERAIAYKRFEKQKDLVKLLDKIADLEREQRKYQDVIWRFNMMGF